MSAEVHDVLVKARALIADPERWCKGALARDEAGRATDPEGDEACQWCLEGAIDRAAREMMLSAEVLSAIVPLLADPPYSFNDSRTHAEVLALFDRAIEATKP